jgi:drug/metabolite transporter (DMT)-like permease
MTHLSDLAVTSPASYLIALLLPALDVIIPVRRRTFVIATACAGVIWACYAFFIGRLGGQAFESRPWAGLLLAFGAALAITGLTELVRRLQPWRWLRRATPEPPPAVAQPGSRWALTARASGSSSGTSITSTPRASSQADPPPGTKIGGSRQASTTRVIPAAVMSSQHDRGRDRRRRQGSSEE